MNKKAKGLMRYEKRNQFVLIALLVIAVLGGAGYFTYRTFSTTGDGAIAMMNKEEGHALERLLTIDPAMRADEVFGILGQPTDDLYVMAKWNGFGGSGLSQARVYFAHGHPRMIRWIKLGAFVYEKRLSAVVD